METLTVARVGCNATGARTTKGDPMPYVSYVPLAAVDSELQAVMREYDAELGGSEFVRVFAHAPEVFKSFIRY